MTSRRTKYENNARHCGAQNPKPILDIAAHSSSATLAHSKLSKEKERGGQRENREREGRGDKEKEEGRREKRKLGERKRNREEKRKGRGKGQGEKRGHNAGRGKEETKTLIPSSKISQISDENNDEKKSCDEETVRMHCHHYHSMPALGTYSGALIRLK